MSEIKVIRNGNQIKSVQTATTPEQIKENAPEITKDSGPKIVQMEVMLTATGRPSVQGLRRCTDCNILEKDTLAKNPKYSFCKGVCVFCYAKRRSLKNKSPEQIQAKIAELQKTLDSLKTTK